MRRVCVVVAFTLAVVAGCGSSPGGPDDAAGPGPSHRPSPRPSPTATATATATPASDPGAAWFGDAESSSITRVARRAQQTGARALDDRRIEGCDSAGKRSYRAWRRCWHRLLDPLSRALGGLAAGIGSTARSELPEACVVQIRKAERLIYRFRDRVAALAEGIDSEDRTAQERAMRTYVTVLRSIAQGYEKPFQALTRACYSPQDRESAEAAPNTAP